MPYKYNVSCVPFRYGAPYLNNKIRKLNKKLKHLTNKYNHIQLLELYNLQKNNYTTFGLHLYSTGKLKICQNLCELINRPKENQIPVIITGNQQTRFLDNIPCIKKQI